MTQNLNKAVRADETSHRTQRAHKTCVRLRRWENQRRLSSFNLWSFVMPMNISKRYRAFGDFSAELLIYSNCARRWRNAGLLSVSRDL